MNQSSAPRSARGRAPGVAVSRAGRAPAPTPAAAAHAVVPARREANSWSWRALRSPRFSELTDRCAVHRAAHTAQCPSAPRPADARTPCARALRRLTQPDITNADRRRTPRSERERHALDNSLPPAAEHLVASVERLCRRPKTRQIDHLERPRVESAGNGRTVACVAREDPHPLGRPSMVLGLPPRSDGRSDDLLPRRLLIWLGEEVAHGVTGMHLTLRRIVPRQTAPRSSQRSAGGFAGPGGGASLPNAPGCSGSRSRISTPPFSESVTIHRSSFDSHSRLIGASSRVSSSVIR